jgi:nuclear GTP-binding protein
VILDWNSGRIPFYTTPPAAGLAVESHVSSAIVSGWSQEFQLAEIAELENASLQTLKGSDSHGRMLVMNSGIQTHADLDMEEIPEGYDLDDEDDEDDARYATHGWFGINIY